MEQTNTAAIKHYVGSTERAFAAHVNDLNDFYLHPESYHNLVINLGQELFNEYSQPFDESLNNVKLEVGDYCACPSESEDWYRGIIRQLDSNGVAIVFKIDYGDIQIIPIKFLRPLQGRFFKLQSLAVHCSLANLVRPIEGWPLDVIEEFRSRITTTFLYAKFINFNEIRDIAEVEITQKTSKTPLNKDFDQDPTQRSKLELNDKSVYKYIPMERLELNQSYQIRLLYYISPSRFYVYLPDKTASHLSFQKDLQKVIQNLYPLKSPIKYQAITVQDNHAVWHRAIILNISPDQSKLGVYFTDIGQMEYISITNARTLPEEYQRKPAFAIPCCLHNAYPLNGNEQLIWTSNDPVHEEFNIIMIKDVQCQVYSKQIQLYYDIQIDIPKIGDLGLLLSEKKLIVRTAMQGTKRPPYNPNSTIRQYLQPSGVPPSLRQQQPQQRFQQPNNMPQQQSTRMINPNMQQVTNQSSTSIPVVQPENGYYTISLVRTAAEFYGIPENREMELENLFKLLANHYNNISNDQSLNGTFFFEGTPCVILEGDKYHRVVIKHRESESKVSIKFIDRGDEVAVGIAELLTIDNTFTTIPAFAQPFCLNGYEESKTSVNLTIQLKKSILNQHVYINKCGSPINGYYPVEVFINNNQSINTILLSSEKNPSNMPSNAVNRSTHNQPLPTHIASQVFSNSSRYHHPQTSHDSSGRSDLNQRTNDVLLPPQKLLTGPTRNQPGRFGSGGSGPTNSNPPSNEPTTRFSQFSNRHQDSTWNQDQNTKPNIGSGQRQPSSSQINSNQRIDDNKTSFQSSFDTKRPFTNAFSNNDHNEREKDGGFRRGGGLTRGGLHSDRGRGNSFGGSNMGRNNNEENNENTHPSSGGFSRRGGGSFSDRGGRGGTFQERNGSYRSRNDDNNGDNNTRGGFRGGRGGRDGFGHQGENGDSGGRGGQRGGFRGSGHGGTRSGFGGGSRGGGRGDHRDRSEAGIHLSEGNSNSSKTFSGWSSAQSSTSNFESGDRFIENEIPKQSFKFVISYVEKSDDFFIQLLSKADELEKLSETLQDNIQQSPAIDSSSLKENQACLVKSSEYHCWYRAIIVSTGISTTKIRFIDFGDIINVNSNTIRQIAKKHCIAPPYAYQCTFPNNQTVENIEKIHFIDKCAGKEFNGKIERKTSDGKFILESDDLIKHLLESNDSIKPIPISTKPKAPEIILPRSKCHICHIENEQHEFYIQDDPDTVDKIADLIENEKTTNPTLTIDEIQQLEPNTIIIGIYEDDSYRGIIKQNNESDENLDVCFIDFGNTSSCPKDSLKRCSEELSKYPGQAKHCRLYGITTDQLDKAYQDLSEKSDSENIEYSIINDKNQILDVLIFIDNKCFNENFGYDPSSQIPVEPEEDKLSSTCESSKYHRGLLTHIEPTKPYVYLQLSESESIISKIDGIIKTLVQENKHNSSYETSSYVIAKFSEDGNYYRARIESYSSTTELYTVYFLDYGNIDENVTVDNIYSYSDDLKEIPPQAHGYLLNEIDSNTWEDTVRPLVENRLNDEVEFYYTDDNHSTIHLNFDNENNTEAHDTETHGEENNTETHGEENNTETHDEENNTETHGEENNVETHDGQNKIVQANISGVDKDCFYIHILPDDNLHINELEENLQTIDKQTQETWTIDDLCLVSNEENRLYRGKILLINENQYDVQCIDYGNILHNLSNDRLYILSNEDIYKQPSIAHQCRLYEVNENNQIKANEDIIKNIPLSEHVTIKIENDDTCLFVTLIRENNENINEKYFEENNQTIIENQDKQESDNEEKQEIIIEENSSEQVNTNEQSVNITENNITNNQTIDFGENDPSTTAIKDEDANISIQAN